MNSPGALALGTLVVRDQRVVYASTGLAELLGRHPHDLMGLAFLELVAPEDRSGIGARLGRRLRGEPVDGDDELQLLLGDGGRRTVAAQFTLEGHGEVVIRLRDRSDLEALHRLGALAGGALELPELLRQATEVVRHAVACEAVAIFGADADARVLRLLQAAGAPPDLASVFGSVPFDSPLGQAVSSRRLHVEQVEAARPSSRVWLERAGFATFAFVPLVSRSRVVGAMVTGWRTRRAEGACRADLLLAMGAHFAAAIEADHLLGDLRRRVRGLEAVHALALRIFAGAPGDPVPLLQDACAEIAGAFSARQAVVMLLEDGERSLRQVAAHGQPVPEQLRTLPLERSRLAQEALESGTPVATPDTFGDPRSAMFGVTEPAGVAMLTVPLVARGRRRGVIFVGDRAGRHFGEADLALATTLGAEVALALENADLYGESLRAHARVLATNADLRRANERNVRQERLAALGEFSAVVAHEVRNPLGVIFNSLGSIRRLLQPTGDARLLLDIIGEESDRLNRMVGDLLDFARPTPPQLQLERLERVVDDAVSAALLGPPGTIDVLRQVEPGLPPVPVDARLVRQALLNVATNALQAMPRGGRLTVRVRAEGEAVVVELEDTGGGIAEDVRARIFEPFFTTKATGTGLGLAVVRRIVEGHGGEITVETRPGVGTRFALRFPLRSDAGPADLETATDLG